MTTETTPELAEIAVKTGTDICLSISFCDMIAFTEALLKDPQFLALAAKQMGGEAVAWTSTRHHGQITQDKLIADCWKNIGWDVAELYTAPQPPLDREQALEDLSASSAELGGEAVAEVNIFLGRITNFIHSLPDGMHKLYTTPQPPLDSEQALEGLSASSAELGGYTPDKFTRELAAKLGVTEACGGIDTGDTQRVIFEAVERLQREVAKYQLAQGEVNDALGILDICQVVPLVESLKAQLSKAATPHTVSFLVGAMAGLEAAANTLQGTNLNALENLPHELKVVMNFIDGYSNAIRAINPEDLLK